jgi:peptide chain release factor 3
MVRSGFFVGIVGALQFEVLASRIQQEFDLSVTFEPSTFNSARWVAGLKAEPEKLIAISKQHIAVDHDDDTLLLDRLQWDVDRVMCNDPELRRTATNALSVCPAAPRVTAAGACR